MQYLLFFSSATMVVRKHLNVTLCVRCLYCCFSARITKLVSDYEHVVVWRISSCLKGKMIMWQRSAVAITKE